MTPPTVKERSGGHATQNPLTVFLYLLLRDHVPAGVIERLVQEVETAPPGVTTQLSNGWVGRMAEDYAARLTPFVFPPPDAK